MKKAPAPSRQDKISPDILSLTYGSIVASIAKDFDYNVHEINNQLELFGFNMGQRMVDEYLSKENIEVCLDFADMANKVKNGVQYFLGVNVELTLSPPENKAFHLVLKDNPLYDFVEIPENLNGMIYSNIIAGAIRGALEIIQIRCVVTVQKDQAKGDEQTEFKIEQKEVLTRKPPKDDQQQNK